MAGNFLIRRGQLNRMNRDCQADLIPTCLVGDDVRSLIIQKEMSLVAASPTNQSFGRNANATAARMHTNAAT
jgi:hypothetical protein